MRGSDLPHQSIDVVGVDDEAVASGSDAVALKTAVDAAVVEFHCVAAGRGKFVSADPNAFLVRIVNLHIHNQPRGSLPFCPHSSHILRHLADPHNQH